MPATNDDIKLATDLANRIVAVSQGTVQSVAMIGSRALGTATPGSDLDLVVFVEVSRHSPPWGAPQEKAERKRIQQQVGRAPVPTDLSVRTTDQYAEAADVVGSLEWLAKHQGRFVYSRPPLRSPLVRRSREEVWRDAVNTWIDHAIAGMSGAARLAGTMPQDSRALCQLAVERALNAVLVFHQIPARAKQVEVLVEDLRQVEPSLVSTLTPILSRPYTPPNAGEVVGVVIEHLLHDPRIQDSMRSLREKLVTPPDMKQKKRHS